MISFDTLEIDNIRELIREFNNDESVNLLENYYQSKSFSEIVGVSRKELAHSNFLAWLLCDTESHKLAEFPIRKFLELLTFYSNENQKNKHKNLFDSIIVSDYTFENILIEKELAIKEVGRIDLYIELDLIVDNEKKKVRVIIENKVTTKEHSEQTLSYYEHFNAIKTKGEINIYTYLTPISSLELTELTEPECSCKEFIQINYQSIVEYILEPALKKDIPVKTEFIIKEYLQSLSQPSIEYDSEEFKQGLIMALGTDERNLLIKFWDKNQTLILSALYAISSDPKQDKDVRDSVSDALNNLSGTEKDRSLISIKYKGVLEVEKIKKSDIGNSTVNILKKHDLIDNELFDFLKEDKSCSFSLLKTKDEITEAESKYRRYRENHEPELTFNNQAYYIARNWGAYNIKGFIDKMSEKIEGLEYIIHE